MTSYPRNRETIDPAKLEKLAEVAVKVGLGLQPGQDLIMTAPIAAAPLARKVAEQAYKAGAGLVTTLYSDEELTLARYRNGRDISFDRAAGWLYDGMAKAFGENTARLGIYGENPMLLSEQDPEKVARANKANSMAYRPALEKIAGFDISQNPGITATLYNLGNPEARAYALKAENDKRRAAGLEPKLPEENYYGWLVNEKLPELQALF